MPARSTDRGTARHGTAAGCARGRHSRLRFSRSRPPRQDRLRRRCAISVAESTTRCPLTRGLAPARPTHQSQQGADGGVPRQLENRPGRFPQCAYGHPHALAGCGHWRPRRRSCRCPHLRGKPLQSPGMPVYSLPASSVARARKHGAIIGQCSPHTQGCPYNWTPAQFSLGGDALDHRRGVLQRKGAPHQPATLPWLEVGGGVRAAAPPGSSGELARLVCGSTGGLAQQGAGDRQGAHRQQAVRRPRRRICATLHRARPWPGTTRGADRITGDRRPVGHGGTRAGVGHSGALVPTATGAGGGKATRPDAPPVAVVNSSQPGDPGQGKLRGPPIPARATPPLPAPRTRLRAHVLSGQIVRSGRCQSVTEISGMRLPHRRIPQAEKYHAPDRQPLPGSSPAAHVEGQLHPLKTNLSDRIRAPHPRRHQHRHLPPGPQAPQPGTASNRGRRDGRSTHPW